MKAKQQREIEKKLLTPAQLRELRAFDAQMRRSNKRYNELITCESDLSLEDYVEYTNFSWNEGAGRGSSGE
jgi:hypothetical protein